MAACTMTRCMSCERVMRCTVPRSTALWRILVWPAVSPSAVEKVMVIVSP
jgi:hypothetical protein